MLPTATTLSSEQQFLLGPLLADDEALLKERMNSILRGRILWDNLTIDLMDTILWSLGLDLDFNALTLCFLD